MNKRYIKIALLALFAIVLTIVPAFDNWFYGFEDLGENFSFLTWNAQLMVAHGEIYGFAGNPFITLILIFSAIVISTIANIVISALENKSNENRVTLGWASAGFSMFSIVLLIISLKKILYAFYGSSMDGIMLGVYLAFALAVIIAIVSFIDAGSNREPAVENKFENIDKIIALKELLDAGAITQEDFDEKKKDLFK